MPNDVLDEKQQGELVEGVTKVLTDYFIDGRIDDSDELQAFQQRYPTPTRMASVICRLRWCEFHTFFVLPRIHEHSEAKSLAKKIEALWPSQEEIRKADCALIPRLGASGQSVSFETYSESSLEPIFGRLIDIDTRRQHGLISIYRLLYLSQSPKFQLGEKLAVYITPEDTTKLINDVSSYIESSAGQIDPMLDRANESFEHFKYTRGTGLTIALNLADYLLTATTGGTVRENSEKIQQSLCQRDHSVMLARLESVRAEKRCWQAGDLERVLIRLSSHQILLKALFKQSDSNGNVTIELRKPSRFSMKTAIKANELSSQQWLACVFELEKVPNCSLSEELRREMPVEHFCTLLEELSLARPDLIGLCVYKLSDLAPEVGASLMAEKMAPHAERVLRAIEKLDYLVRKSGGHLHYPHAKAAFIAHHDKTFNQYIDAWNRYQFVAYDSGTIRQRVDEISTPEYKSGEGGRRPLNIRFPTVPGALNAVQAKDCIVSAMQCLRTVSEAEGESVAVDATRETHRNVKAFIQDGVAVFLNQVNGADQFKGWFESILSELAPTNQALMVAMLLDHPLHNKDWLGSCIESHMTVLEDHMSSVAKIELEIQSKLSSYYGESTKLAPRVDENTPRMLEGKNQIRQALRKVRGESDEQKSDAPQTAAINFDLSEAWEPEQIARLITRAIESLAKVPHGMRQAPYRVVHSFVVLAIERLCTMKGAIQKLIEEINAISDEGERVLVWTMLSASPLIEPKLLLVEDRVILRNAFTNFTRENTSAIVRDINKIQSCDQHILDRLVKYGLSSNLDLSILADKHFEDIWIKLTELRELASAEVDPALGQALVQTLGQIAFTENLERLYSNLFAERDDQSFRSTGNDIEDSLATQLGGCKKKFARYILILFAQHSHLNGYLENLPSCMEGVSNIDSLLVDFPAKVLLQGSTPMRDDSALSRTLSDAAEEQKHDYLPEAGYTQPAEVIATLLSTQDDDSSTSMGNDSGDEGARIKEPKQSSVPSGFFSSKNSSSSSGNEEPVSSECLLM